jgi:hypothetical protein
MKWVCLARAGSERLLDRQARGNRYVRQLWGQDDEASRGMLIAARTEQGKARPAYLSQQFVTMRLPWFNQNLDCGTFLGIYLHVNK